MADPISSIRNLGPAVEESFARAGITSAEELREMGADAGYLRLLQSGSRPHFIAYYALVMGLQGRSWNDLDDTEKADLRGRFDALKVQVTTPSAPAGIEAVLDKIGVGPRREKYV
ncbi:MAG: competence protein TfoX [Rhodobacteraceae bacterium]|jgi:DNA transformation protein|nr:competence protein TfoX [Paracoccaceae bacterium]NCV67081.1 competence protein TfoX [Paracoccaceae bacterium]NCW02852.1 competence protein TfoX [Paracoccaceae bacterium]NCW61087.1 competence protein TfoX [Paracoccaceae bacterium]NCW65691.1 competence protein TfoX [Paracoccaceae bacterium]